MATILQPWQILVAALAGWIGLVGAGQFHSLSSLLSLKPAQA
jgi:hypothetical protein